MLGRLVSHARRHSIAYVALTCSLLALGGASYAAFRLPNGSVGEVQIQNHVIDPVKWNDTYVTGFLRRYATVNATGQLGTSSPNGAATESSPGNYVVTWGDSFSPHCIVQATILGGSTSPPTTTTTGTTTTTTTTTPPPTTTTTSSTSTPTTTTTTTTPPPPGGFADASVTASPRHAAFVAVATFNAAGVQAPEPFSIVVFCTPGAGGGQTFPYTLP